ncbi:MAG: universal stress protein [Thaumarchaeota archaeon]|nr:universal stress protein [Nitrososphaerota archaeon]
MALAAPIFRKILVPIDGSNDSARALGVACKLAKDQKSLVTALYVVQKPGVPDPLDISTTGEILEAMEKYGREVLTTAKIDAERMDVKIDTNVISGYTVANTVVEYAKEGGYDLIVMGTRGRSGLKRVLLGSVAFGVITYANCAVLVVR